MFRDVVGCVEKGQGVGVGRGVVRFGVVNLGRGVVRFVDVRLGRCVVRLGDVRLGLLRLGLVRLGVVRRLGVVLVLFRGEGVVGNNVTGILGTIAGKNPGLDVGTDAGTERGTSAGTDAGIDAGTDFGSEFVSESGVDAKNSHSVTPLSVSLSKTLKISFVELFSYLLFGVIKSYYIYMVSSAANC